MSPLQYIFAALWAGFTVTGAAPTPKNSDPIIILDAGHGPSQFGAVGACGKQEVSYNDEIVALLQQRLRAKYQIYLTREAGQEVKLPEDKALSDKTPQQQGLLARATWANRHHGALFIAIHHDSTAQRHQIPDESHCPNGKKLSAEFKKKYAIGFNLFVWDQPENPQRAASIALAKMLGAQLKKLPIPASNYHLPPDDDCKSCRAVAPDVGVWHQELAVLKHTQMPAVLIEVGNIIDPAQEQLLRSTPFREAFVAQVEEALAQWFSTHP